MGSRLFGNRPDCAYYLLMALCGAAMFTAFGGIFTYMGYWPQIALHHKPDSNNDLSHISNPNYFSYNESDFSLRTYCVVGPLCIVIGLAIAITVGILAIKYDCEYEPEEPKVAIMRLASEMSLNLSTGTAGESKYELMRTQRCTTPGSSSHVPATVTVDEVISRNPHHLV